jgi:hypothetical protein
VKTNASSVEIIVNKEGVSVVRLFGESWDDEQTGREIYGKIRPLVREIDRVIKASEGEEVNESVVSKCSIGAEQTQSQATKREVKSQAEQVDAPMERQS